MSDTDATKARQDVVADVDEIIEHVINANMLSMPYHVYSELFDAVDGLGVKVEKLQDENRKLRELCVTTTASQTPCAPNMNATGAASATRAHASAVC